MCVCVHLSLSDCRRCWTRRSRRARTWRVWVRSYWRTSRSWRRPWRRSRLTETSRSALTLCPVTNTPHTHQHNTFLNNNNYYYNSNNNPYSLDLAKEIWSLYLTRLWVSETYTVCSEVKYTLTIAVPREQWGLRVLQPWSTGLGLKWQPFDYKPEALTSRP